MDRGEYIKTPEGAARRLRDRRRKRIRVTIDQSRLAKKGSVSPEDGEEFQAQLKEQLTEQRRTALRGPTVLRIRLRTDGCHSLAGLHALVKNYQDLLQERGQSHRRRVFIDDSQVDVLVAELALSTSTSLLTEAYPLRHLMEDLGVVDSLDDDLMEERDGLGAFGEIGENESRSDPYYIDGLVEQANLYRSRADTETNEDRRAGLRLGEKQARARIQDYLLHAGNDFFQLAVEVLARRNCRAHLFTFMQSIPLVVEMPQVPTMQGQYKEYRQGIRSRFQALADDKSYLTPLHVPVSLTLVHVPPADGISRDLDNIARRVIKEFNHVFEPNLQRWTKAELKYLANAPDLPDGGAIFQRSLDFVPRAPTSISRYQAVRLPRLDTDPKEGSLHVALGSAPMEDWLTSVDRRLERWCERVDGV